ncbi:transporter substrate-binding domain-containing protein [Rhodoferax bucti]|uniref:transporter substrate-binding domain-containing protein n=1 Tax=Rhodoferax bucti TaxID=2576305 RepID=UPI001107BF8D|nr:transporter substrate-binding domain-containing protein [Rhodoferax bucti]
MAYTFGPRWRIALASIGLPMALLWATPGQAQVVRFAPEKDYPPFVSAGATGRAQGLSIDVLELLQPHLGMQVQMLPPDNLANILQAARRGEVDLISSLRPTPERAEYLTFTEPYVKVPAVLVARQGAAPPNLKDLSGRPVAVGKGYAVEGFVHANYPHVRWVAVPDDLTALRGLMAGEFDGVVADVASVSDATRLRGIQGVQVVEALPFEYELSFAYRKELTALGAALNAGLKELTPATRQVLLRRWIDTDTLMYENPRIAGVRKLALVFAGLAALGWAIWRVRQRRSAARETHAD